MHKSPKVLIIGLDGATWKLLNPWIQEGKLPWFRKIKRQWFSSILKSTLPPLTGPAWVSFQTGVNPGKHGILDFIHYTEDRLFNLVSPDDNPYPTIWQWLEKGGKKCVVVNMPMTYPIQKGKSIIVSSLMTPPGRQYAWPNSVFEQLKSIEYQVDLEKMTFGIPEESMRKRDKLYKQALSMARKRKLAAVMLLEKEWDFFFVLFKSTDITQHLFWNEDETLKLYQRLEKYVQQIINHAQKKYGENVFIIICSDHGFDRGETSAFCLYRWLEAEGYLKEESPQPYNLLRMGYQLLKTIVPVIAKKGTIEETRKRLTKREGQERLVFMRRRAKAWPTPFGVYVNDLSLLKEIKRKLEQLRYKKKKVFKRVYEKQEVYSGENLDSIPDLVFLPERWVKIESNPTQEKIWKKKRGYLKGNHNADPNGILVIKPVRDIVIKKMKQCNIMDIFPTVVEVLQEPIPPYCDGKSLIVRRKEATEMSARQRKRVETKIKEEIRRL